MTDDMCSPADAAGELWTLRSSYDQLHPLHKEAYRLLAHHPRPMFSSQAAAAMLRACDLATEEALRELCQRDLLEEGKYGWRMPDPVREHALALALGEQFAQDLPTQKRITDLRARLTQAAARSSTHTSQASQANGGDQSSDE